MRTLVVLALAVHAAPAVAEGAPFDLVDGWGWGGQRLVTPIGLPCSLTAQPAPQSLPRHGLARPVFASLPLLSVRTYEGRSLVWIAATEKGDYVYVDGNDDRILSPREGALMKAGAVDFPGAQDRPGATLSVAIPLGGGKRAQRQLSVWMGPLPSTLMAVLRGYLHGRVQLGDKLVEAFIADGDGNGSFADMPADQLWLDLNGDGKLDPLTEEFALQRLVRIDDQRYRIGVEEPSYRVRFESVLQRTGKLKLIHQTRPGIQVKSITAGLASTDGEAVKAPAGAAIDCPAGRYRAGSLKITLVDEKQVSWTYTFSRLFYQQRAKTYPLMVEPDRVNEVDPLADLTTVVWGESKSSAGGEFHLGPAMETPSLLQSWHVVRSKPGSEVPDNVGDHAGLVEVFGPDGTRVFSARHNVTGDYRIGYVTFHVPKTAPTGTYKVRCTVDWGPLLGKQVAEREVTVLPR